MKKLKCLLFSWLNGFHFKIKARQDKLPLSFFFQKAQITHLCIYTSYCYSVSNSIFIYLCLWQLLTFVVWYSVLNIPSFSAHASWSFIMWMPFLLLQIFLNIEKMKQCQNTIHTCGISVNYVRYAEGFIQFLYLLNVCFNV